MNEQDLQALWRRRGEITGARAALPDPSALAAVSLGNADDEQREAVLDAAAHSAREADLLRALLAIADDSEQLAADLRRRAVQQRRQTRPARVRRWLSMAAGVALAAALALMLRSPVDVTAPERADQPAEVADDERILAASFEPTESDDPAPEQRAIFRGSFDS